MHATRSMSVGLVRGGLPQRRQDGLYGAMGPIGRDDLGKGLGHRCLQMQGLVSEISDASQGGRSVQVGQDGGVRPPHAALGDRQQSGRRAAVAYVTGTRSASAWERAAGSR